MKTKHFLIAAIIIFSAVFLGLKLEDHDMYASGTRVVLMILLVILYSRQVKSKNIYFLLFLTLFSVAQLMDFLSYFNKLGLTQKIDYFYYIGNGLNILAYTFLIIKVLKGMNLKEVVTKLSAHIVVLVVLDIFCVTIITNAARDTLITSEQSFSIYEYSMEFLYNTVVMSLLTLAVINYIHKVDKKAMNLLLGSIFIVFSEMIQMAYFYVYNINVLNVLCSLFLVLAFLFLYLQASLEPAEKFNTFKEHLEA